MDDGAIFQVYMKKEAPSFYLNKKQQIPLPLLLSLLPIVNGLRAIHNSYSIERLIKLWQA
jgi:hypothetical protein